MFSKSDYIMRMAKAVSAVLLKVAFNRKKKLYDEGLAEIQKSTKDIIGLNYDSINKLPIESLMQVLKINEDLYPGKCLALARLLKEEAEIHVLQGRVEEGKDNYIRSFALYKEVLNFSSKISGDYVDSLQKDKDSVSDALKKLSVTEETIR
jgi:hypothetical protein